MLPEVPGGQWKVSLYRDSTVVSLEFTENGITWTPTNTIAPTDDPNIILRAAEHLVENLGQLRLRSAPDFELIERQRQLREKLGLK